LAFLTGVFSPAKSGIVAARKMKTKKTAKKALFMRTPPLKNIKLSGLYLDKGFDLSVWQGHPPKLRPDPFFLPGWP
jgi:hypothetical protein